MYIYDHGDTDTIWLSIFKDCTAFQINKKKTLVETGEVMCRGE